MKPNWTRTSTFHVQGSSFAVLVLLLLFLASAASGFAAVRYVDANSTNAMPPYTSWATAAATIQQAVDAATPGDEIVVTNGTYATGGRAVGTNVLANRVAVDKPIALRSVNGPQFTIIQGAKAPGGGNGDGAIRCSYLADGASLSGFTLTNGATRKWPETSDDRERNGGGVWCASTNSALTNCVITSNSASDDGGGASGGTLRDCTLTGNSAESDGGGASGGTLYNCTLTANSAGWKGGGAVSTLYNCMLSGNSAGEAGGGVAGNTLYQCTLIANSADHGGGASGDEGWPCTLHNCLVYFNRAPDGANYSEWTTFDHSCTTPLPPGQGNIAADPQLASATHLSPASPCIGAGDPAYAKGVDIDGEPWATPPAIGADQPGLAIGPLSLWIDTGYTNVATDYAVLFTALNTGAMLQSVWDFGDGTLLTNQPFATHAWSAPGLYTVQLTGYNDSNPGGVTASEVVRVSAGIHYVSQACANPTFPYTSWETAATNIQEAIEAAPQAGGSVLVSNGSYATGGRAVGTNVLLNRVAVDKPLALRSVNGPEFTIIQGAKAPGGANGEGAVRCVYLTDGASLSGFTLANGATRPASGDEREYKGGGVFCAATNATLTNCVIIGNSAAYAGGASGGTLHNCTLTGNWADSTGGGAYFSVLHNCTLRGNSAVYAGGATWVSTLYNCDLTANSAKFQGGGAGVSTLYNCVLTSNSAESGGGASGGTLVNCTVTGNSAEWGGGVGGFFEMGVLECSLRNCIVYFNRAPDGANYSEWTTFDHSCTTPLPTNGVGNIDADPRFVNAAAGDFRLRPDSPCIDAGTNFSDLISTDILGLPRTLDGNGDGIVRVDMGAYEFNPYRFEPALQLIANGLVFTIWGELGKSVRVERSRDLVTWEAVGTVPIPASGQTLIDPAATTEPFLFYRAVSAP